MNCMYETMCSFSFLLILQPHSPSILISKIKSRLGNSHPHAKATAANHRLLKALGLLQWITFIYFHYTIKQQETINFSHQTTSRTHKAKAVA